MPLFENKRHIRRWSVPLLIDKGGFRVGYFTRRVNLALAAVVLIFLAAGGCDEKTKPVQSTNVETGQGTSLPELAEVEVRDLGDNVQVSITLEGYERTRIMARLEGYIGQVEVDIGDKVSKDQVVARLDLPEMEAEIRRKEKLVVRAEAYIVSQEAHVAQSEAKLAGISAKQEMLVTTLSRIQRLVDSQALTPERLDEARFAVKSANAGLETARAAIVSAKAQRRSAEADLEVAKADLDKTRALGSYMEIRAPFDGVITQRNVDTGAFVRPPSGNTDVIPVFEIESTHKLRGVVMLPIKDARKLDPGDQVELNDIYGHTGPPIEAVVSRTSKVLSRGSRMMRGEIDLDNPIDEKTGKRLLRPGDYGKATITLDIFEQSTIVPLSSVGEDGRERYVMVIDASNQVHRRVVDIVFEKTSSTGSDVAISGQIQAGERVVARNPGRFTDGQQLMDN